MGPRTIQWKDKKVQGLEGEIKVQKIQNDTKPPFKSSGRPVTKVRLQLVLELDFETGSRVTPEGVFVVLSHDLT